MEYQLFGINLVSNYPFTGKLLTGKARADPMQPAQSVAFACSQLPPFPVKWKFRKLEHFQGRNPADREVHNEIYHLDTYDVMRFGWGADFYLRSDRIDCHLRNPARQAWVEPNLLGAVLAFWLERQGLPALHASAVTKANQTVAFLAHSGKGKSTLAASFVKDGSALLTDDILPVEQQTERFLGRPGPPLINLWPDQMVCFMGANQPEFKEAEAGLPKKRVPVEAIKHGSFCAERQPLTCIYILSKSDQAAGGNGIEITCVPPAEAAIELIRYSYIPAATCEGLGWQSRRLDFFARLVRQVPVRRLVYPAGFEHLERVTEAVMRDLENLPGQT